MARYFGTDGIRGVALKELTVETAYRIGRYIGQYPDGKGNRILISRDTRESGETLLRAICEGIVASGGRVYDEGISTTPSVSYLVETLHFDYGIMISASHNPYADNGIKLFESSGEKLSEQIEEKIEDYIDSPSDYLPKKEGQYLFSPSLKQQYVDWLISKYDGKTPVKVVLDCANGSASYVAPELFARLGIEAKLLSCAPDGRNINAGCGSTHLDNLSKAMESGEFDIGFAFDGDADRCLAIDRSGRVIDGDAAIFLGALSLRGKGLLSQGKVVITVMSNFGLRKALQEEGIGYEIVSVGDKYVQAKLKEDGLSIGGEQSGHVIFASDLNTGDGLLTALRILGIYASEKSVYAKLSDLKVYPQTLVNIRFNSRKEALDALNSDQVKEQIRSAESALSSSGRLLVRTSGTEPLVRVMAECLDEELCQRQVNGIVDKIKESMECVE